MDEVVDWLSFYDTYRPRSALDYVSPMSLRKTRPPLSVASGLIPSAMGLTKQGQRQTGRRSETMATTA
jgi:hypothetical protein